MGGRFHLVNIVETKILTQRQREPRQESARGTCCPVGNPCCTLCAPRPASEIRPGTRRSHPTLPRQRTPRSRRSLRAGGLMCYGPSRIGWLRSRMNDSARLAQRIERALKLATPPVAVTLRDTVATGVETPHVPVPAGCSFWVLARRLSFAGWAAGVATSAAADWLRAKRDQIGRVAVGPRLEVDDRDGVFVIGDAARVEDPQGLALPGSCRSQSNWESKLES